MRGRVMALYMTVLMGGTPIGSPFIGWVGQAFGARYSLIVGGGLTVLGTVGSVVYFSRRRGLAIRPRLLPRPRLEVLPQTELLADKAAVDAGPLVTATGLVVADAEPVVADAGHRVADAGPRVA
jgi:MFS family permease